MIGFYKIILISFLILSQCPVFADDLIEIEDIWLTQDVHVTGDLLCQDGQYVYFKDEQSCMEATDWSCKESLKVSPIHFIEKVELPSGEFVTHFFNIKTSYDYMKYELVSFHPIKSYDLVESKQIEFPVCSGMTLLPKKKVRKIRQVKMDELSFMDGLIKSGVSVVNSPYGSFSELAKKAVVNKPAPNMWSTEFPKLKSPLCNTSLDYSDIIIKTSGEWSGNGVVQLASLNEWQNKSNDLFMNIKKDKSQGNKFEFYCRQEGYDDK